jgi:hypothetical protein
MKGVTRRLLGLCLPALLAWALDNSVTLVGQSPAYWAGNYAAVNEGSPTFNQLLQIHPTAFALGAVVWAGVFTGIILLLPDVLALIISIAVTLGHTVGAATWILYRFGYGYQMCNALFLGSAIALGLGIRYGWRAVPADEYDLRGWSWRRRWIVAALLFAVGTYLFLWPRSP